MQTNMSFLRPIHLVCPCFHSAHFTNQTRHINIILEYYYYNVFLYMFLSVFMFLCFYQTPCLYWMLTVMDTLNIAFIVYTLMYKMYTNGTSTK